jgi:hypothetical protein
MVGFLDAEPKHKSKVRTILNSPTRKKGGFYPYSSFLPICLSTNMLPGTVRDSN